MAPEQIREMVRAEVLAKRDALLEKQRSALGKSDEEFKQYLDEDDED